MHRQASGLFISEPINVSTWHQIRLGPLTTLEPSLTVTDLGDLENTRTQHFFCRHSFVNNKSVYKETHHSLLIHYNVLQKMATLSDVCDLNIDTTIWS